MTRSGGTTSAPPNLVGSEPDNDVRRIADAHECSVMLPAGCGKTELLARAVAHGSTNSAPQLVLTHTHAGVHAIRARLRRLRVASDTVQVTTIAGWALRIASAYPTLSGLTQPTPGTSADWNAVHRGVTEALASPHLRRVLTASYGGVYVDEYQDCTIQQHGLVLRLAGSLPVRLFGDPLQSIFGFGSNAVVDWDTDVTPHFPPLPVAAHPWRWAGTNPGLGAWLYADLRERLLRQLPIHLDDTPVDWRSTRHPATQHQACVRIAQQPGSAVAIHQYANQCHSLAQRLGGQFTSMEELESRDLLAAASTLDQAEGLAVLVALLEFAKRCIAGLPPAVGRAVGALQTACRPSPLIARQHPALHRSLLAAAENPSPSNLLTAMQAIEELPGIVIYRQELWRELKRALRIQHDESPSTVRDAVLTARDRTRRHGRDVEHRSVSRTLLVKGLEYAHAIVLDADVLDITNLYVAMTRGSTTLTVLSNRSRLTPRPPR
jgi:hypothetical protein